MLVTGASTGIGRAIVEDLVAQGTPVFAGVRTLADAPPHDLVTPVRLDVTSADDISAAATLIEERAGKAGLRGLVNNAGIGVGGAIEFLDLDELRRQLEVNLIGQLAVTQACIPLLRSHGHGRIVFLGSVASRVGIPFMSPYVASKHAIVGVAESLRRELAPWGIAVSTLLPGAIATAIWDKVEASSEQLRASMPPEALQLYGDTFDAMDHFLTASGKAGIPPAKVAEVAHKALFARRPRAEYVVGSDARGLFTLSALLPSRTVDSLMARQLRGK